MIHRSIRFLVLCFTGCLVFYSCQYQRPLYPAIPEESGRFVDPALVYGVLPNGLQYVIRNNTTPRHRVSLHLNVFAGSMNETDEELGMAHFLEHMVFNGSEHFQPGELARYFPSIGMDFGGDANAHTSFFNTVYDLKLPKGDSEMLDQAFLIFQDYARGAFLLESEIDRERGVILSEMRERDSVSYRTFKQTLAFELPGSLYLDRFPIGTEEIIRKTDHKSLKAFYDKWYRPENMVLIVVGDIDPTLVQRKIREQFGKLRPAAGVAAPVFHPETKWQPHQGVKSFYYFEPEAGSTDVTIESLSWKPHVSKTPGMIRQQMLMRLCSLLIQNRLNRMMVEKTAHFSDADAFSGVYLRHISTNAVSATCTPAEWEKTLEQLENTLRQALKFGFEQSELERVRADIIASLEQMANQSDTRRTENVAQRIISTIQQKGLLLSDRQRLDLLKPYLLGLSLADVHKAFQNAWADDSRLVIMTGNAVLEKENAAGKMMDVFQSAASVPVQKYQAAKAKPFPYLEPENEVFQVKTRKHYDGFLDITAIEFENNIRLNFKQTDFAQKEIRFKACFGKGRKSEPENKPGLALIAGMLVDESGFGQMNIDQLQTALAGRNVSMSFDVGDEYFSLSGTAAPDEAGLMMSLIYHFFHDPGYRDHILDIIKERYRQEYDAMIRTPDGMMQIRGLPLLSGGAAGLEMPDPDVVDRYTVDDVRQWMDHEIRSAGLEISIIGDIDDKTLIPIAAASIERFSVRNPFEEKSLKKTPVRFPAGKLFRLELDSQLDKEMVRLAFRTDDFWNIAQTRRLNILARVFTERLRLRLREEMGETYSPYVYNDPSMIHEGFGLMHVVVNVAEGTSRHIFSAVADILEKMHEEGISKEETVLALKPVLSHLAAVHQSNRYWLNSVMAGSAWHPDRFEWTQKMVEDYSSINEMDLTDLMEKFLNMENSARIVISSGKRE